MDSSPRYPFTYYSSVINQFCYLDQDNDNVRGKDMSGKVYSDAEFDRVLPMFYYRQLAMENAIPDSIQGIPVDRQTIAQNNFFFWYKPKDKNTPVIELYPMFESCSGKVDLENPSDMFRLKENIEFIDMASNTVDTAKSALFTGTMRRKGVRFPVAEISGNPSARKEYDEGYVLLDADRRLFHLKMVQGRPYVRAVGLPEGVRPEHLFITEFHGRRTLALLTDAENRLYAVTMPGYGVRRVGTVEFDPRREAMSIVGTLLNWTVCVEGAAAERYYAVSADDLSQLDTLVFPLSDRHVPGLSFTSATDNYVRPRLR